MLSLFAIVSSVHYGLYCTVRNLYLITEFVFPFFFSFSFFFSFDDDDNGFVCVCVTREKLMPFPLQLLDIVRFISTFSISHRNEMR